MPTRASPSRRAVLATLATAAGGSLALAAPVRASLSEPPPAPTFLKVKTRDGLTLAAEVQGEPGAPEIVFVHGLRQSRLSWDRQFASPDLAGFRLIRFDLRGHGDSGKPDDPSAYSDLTVWGDDLAAVLDAGQARRPVLVGWSLGGAVIGGYLSKHAGRPIAGVNLVDGVTRFSSDYLTQASLDFAVRTAAPDLALRSAAVAEFLRACFRNPPTGAEYEALLVINGMMTNAVNLGLAKAAADLDPALRAYRGPLLLTHGAHDRLLKVAMSEHNRDLHAGATLSLYPDSGHSPFYEDAARFNQELRAFPEAGGQGRS